MREHPPVEVMGAFALGVYSSQNLNLLEPLRNTIARWSNVDTQSEALSVEVRQPEVAAWLHSMLESLQCAMHKMRDLHRKSDRTSAHIGGAFVSWVKVQLFSVLGALLNGGICAVIFL
ncbi:hypothetical protein GOP47_0030149 [Adiantum capillus-veneris]|nr:hypothetical protein GOP47_0030149 [Adiantum capillus-veneris]